MMPSALLFPAPALSNSGNLQPHLTIFINGTNKAKLEQVGKLFMVVAEPIKEMQNVHIFLRVCMVRR